MIDKIIESLESMAEDMRAMGDIEKASGVDSALWLIEEITKTADTPQTEKPKIRKRIDKPFRAVWLDDDHNEIGTPQTDFVEDDKCFDCEDFFTCDEHQTDCPRK